MQITGAKPSAWAKPLVFKAAEETSPQDTATPSAAAPAGAAPTQAAASAWALPAQGTEKEWQAASAAPAVQAPPAEEAPLAQQKQQGGQQPAPEPHRHGEGLEVPVEQRVEDLAERQNDAADEQHSEPATPPRPSGASPGASPWRIPAKVSAAVEPSWGPTLLESTKLSPAEQHALRQRQAAESEKLQLERQHSGSPGDGGAPSANKAKSSSGRPIRQRREGPPSASPQRKAKATSDGPAGGAGPAGAQAGRRRNRNGRKGMAPSGPGGGVGKGLRRSRQMYAVAAVRAIEATFQADYLSQDEWLRQHMDTEGYIPIAFVCNYPHVSCYGAFFDDIVRALKDSQSLELDIKNETMRLKDGWSKWLCPNEKGGMGCPRYVKVNKQGADVAADSGDSCSSSDSSGVEPQQV